MSCSKETIYFDNTFNEGKNNISPLDFFNQKEEKYYIYYYSLMCPPCNDLESKMSEFINQNETKVYTLSLQNLNEEDLKLFKVKDDSKTNDEIRNEMIGVSDIKEVILIGTPTLYFINDKSINKIYLGYREIDNFIS